MTPLYRHMLDDIPEKAFRCTMKYTGMLRSAPGFEKCLKGGFSPFAAREGAPHHAARCPATVASNRVALASGGLVSETVGGM